MLNPSRPVHPTRRDVPDTENPHQHGRCSVTSAGAIGLGARMGINLSRPVFNPATSGAVEFVFAGGEQVMFAGGENAVTA